MKSVVKNLFLRGSVLDRWTLWKARRCENHYRKHLLACLDNRSSLGPGASSGVRSRTPLRNLLFIADCMWEIEELVPELARIAPVEVLNLRPHLAPIGKAADKPATVVQAVERFVMQSGEPDAILFYARGSLLSEAVFDLLRRRWKAPLIGMNLDDKAEFFDYRVFRSGNDNYQHWAKLFDLNLTSSVLAADWYRRLNLPVLHCPMGFRRRPENAQPPATASFKYKLSFIGSRRLERDRLVRDIQQAGIPLTLFGTGWPNSNWTENPTVTYRESQLNLGINYWSPAGQGTGSKARDFECPGAGACYLTSFHWELAHYYDIGREVLCWSSLEELIELYSFYAARPEECLRIAQAAHARCANEHTWEHRFRRVFSEMGF